MFDYEHVRVNIEQIVNAFLFVYNCYLIDSQCYVCDGSTIVIVNA